MMLPVHSSWRPVASNIVCGANDNGDGASDVAGPTSLGQMLHLTVTVTMNFDSDSDNGQRDEDASHVFPATRALVLAAALGADACDDYAARLPGLAAGTFRGVVAPAAALYSSSHGDYLPRQSLPGSGSHHRASESRSDLALLLFLPPA